MKPRRTSLRASLHQLAEDFVDGVLDALRSASFPELETLEGPTLPRAADRAPAVRARTELLPTGVLAELTARQRDVFEHASRGSSNNAIARALGIDVKTVQTHRAQVNAKLGVCSPAELVRFAATHGLLNAPHDGAPDPAPVFNLAELERRAIAAALRATGGNRNRAAVLLGISRSALNTKLGAPKPAVTPSSRHAAVRAPDTTKKRSRRANASPRPSARPDASRTESALPRLGEEPDPHPGTAITDPHALLTTPEAPPSSREVLRDLPAPRATPERRPGIRTGEEILQTAQGGVRAPTTSLGRGPGGSFVNVVIHFQGRPRWPFERRQETSHRPGELGPPIPNRFCGRLIVNAPTKPPR